MFRPLQRQLSTPFTVRRFLLPPEMSRYLSPCVGMLDARRYLSGFSQPDQKTLNFNEKVAAVEQKIAAAEQKRIEQDILAELRAKVLSLEARGVTMSHAAPSVPTGLPASTEEKPKPQSEGKER